MVLQTAEGHCDLSGERDICQKYLCKQASIYTVLTGLLKSVGQISGAQERAQEKIPRLTSHSRFGELFAGGPASSAKMDDFSTYFNRNLVAMMKKENFVRNLHLLTSDTRDLCESLNTDASYKAANGSDWRVFNPFDDMYRIVYKLTMRTVGATEIVEDQELLNYTLRIFEEFDRSSSNLRIVFPWLPTPRHLYRLYNGARLYMVFDKILKQRQKEGVKKEDALQFLIDQGADAEDLVTVSLLLLRF